MLLFKKPFWEPLVQGTVTLTFRRWQKPHVRVGGRYRCHPIGVLEVDDVRIVSVGRITGAEAKRAGFADRTALLAYLEELGPLTEKTEVYRVELHHGGDGDRVELALEAALVAEDIETIGLKLKRMDARKPWTMATLEIIEKHPRIAASVLATKLGREKLELKVDIRRLKKLGLTQSFEVGYEISPRGRAYLEAVRAQPKSKPARKKRAS